MRIDPADLAPVGPRRIAGGAALELHAHTSERSLDSGVRADVLVGQAVERGLDGVCLTEHNALWPPDELRALSERHGISVAAGMELGTDVGHVLVYGLDRYHPELLRLERLREIASKEGAALVLAHPMREGDAQRPPWAELARWFDGIEVVNGDHSDGEDGYIARQTQELGLALVGGSDVHSREAVGRVATLFPCPVFEASDIAWLIRTRRTAVADLRPTARRGAK